MWESISPLVNRVVRRNGRYTLDAAREELTSRRWQLWAIWDEGPVAIAITAIVSYPRRMELVVKGAAGTRLREWLHHIEVLHDFAREKGCEVVVIEGRKGWMRKLKDYRLAQVRLEKVL